MLITQPNNVGRGQSNTLPYTPNPSGQIAQSMYWMSAYPLCFSLFSGLTAVTTEQTDPYFQVNTLGRSQFAVQVESTQGTYNATVLIEGTLDGENWSTVQTITSAGITQINGLYAALRVSVTSYTSGTLTCTLVMQRA